MSDVFAERLRRARKMRVYRWMSLAARAMESFQSRLYVSMSMDK